MTTPHRPPLHPCGPGISYRPIWPSTNQRVPAGPSRIPAAQKRQLSGLHSPAVRSPHKRQTRSARAYYSSLRRAYRPEAKASSCAESERPAPSLNGPANRVRSGDRLTNLHEMHRRRARRTRASAYRAMVNQRLQDRSPGASLRPGLTPRLHSVVMVIRRWKLIGRGHVERRVFVCDGPDLVVAGARPGSLEDTGYVRQP